MANTETMFPALSGRAVSQSMRGLEVDVAGAGLVGAGWLLMAHASVMTEQSPWGAMAAGATLLGTGVGLLRRHTWARRAALWLFLLGAISLFAGTWRLDGLLQGLNALRGVRHTERTPSSDMVSLSTDEALLIALAYWGVGWCAWRLWSRDIGRHFEMQDELRRLRRAQRKSPST